MAVTNESYGDGRAQTALHHAWLLCGLVVIAALLRLPLLDRPVWFDEACMSDQRIGTTAQWLATLYVDIHPPLFVSFMHFWNSWFGDSEVAMRTPALLAGLACIPLTWWTGRRLVGERAALLAAALLTLSPVHAWYSAEARLYLPMMLCTLFAFGCVDRLTSDGGARRGWLFWAHAVNVAVMLALHYYLAVVVVALALLAPALTRGFGRRARSLLLLHGVGTLLLGAFVFAKVQMGQFETSQGYLRALDPAELFRFVSVWAWTGNTMQGSGSALLGGLGVGFQWLGVALLALGLVAVLRRLRTAPRGLLTLVGVLLLPGFLLACVAVGYDGTYLERTLIAAVPFVLLLAGAGLSSLPAKCRPTASAATLTLAATALGALYFTYEDRWTVYKPHPDWRSAASYLGGELDDAACCVLPAFTSMPNPRSLSYYDPRIQDAKSLEAGRSPQEVGDQVARRLGETAGGFAEELFAEFAAQKRTLLRRARVVVRRSAPAPSQLTLPDGFDGPFYVVRNEWHPHVSVDDSVERLVAHEQIEVLHTHRCAGVTVYKVRWNR